MDNYGIKFARSARKELEQLPGVLVARILPKIEALASEPQPRGCRKLTGTKNLWRIRIGDYRVVYGIYPDSLTVDIVIVRHRSEAYR